MPSTTRSLKASNTNAMIVFVAFSDGIVVSLVRRVAPYVMLSVAVGDKNSFA
jgi:hypothetical protein